MIIFTLTDMRCSIQWTKKSHPFLPCTTDWGTNKCLTWCIDLEIQHFRLPWRLVIVIINFMNFNDNDGDDDFTLPSSSSSDHPIKVESVCPDNPQPVQITWKIDTLMPKLVSPKVLTSRRIDISLLVMMKTQTSWYVSTLRQVVWVTLCYRDTVVAVLSDCCVTVALGRMKIKRVVQM